MHCHTRGMLSWAPIATISPPCFSPALPGFLSHLSLVALEPSALQGGMDSARKKIGLSPGPSRTLQQQWASWWSVLGKKRSGRHIFFDRSVRNVWSIIYETHAHLCCITLRFFSSISVLVFHIIVIDHVLFIILFLVSPNRIDCAHFCKRITRFSISVVNGSNFRLWGYLHMRDCLFFLSYWTELLVRVSSSLYCSCCLINFYFIFAGCDRLIGVSFVFAAID